MRFFLSCLVAEYLQGYHSTWCSHLWQSFRWSIYGTGIWVYLHFEFAYVAPSLSIQAISKSPPLTKISQALAAASKTVDFRKIVHSFHSYFLLVGDIDSMNQPLIPLPPSKYAFFFSLNSHLIISFLGSPHYISSSSYTWWEQLCHPKSRCYTEREYHLHIDGFFSGSPFYMVYKYTPLTICLRETLAFLFLLL